MVRLRTLLQLTRSGEMGKIRITVLQKHRIVLLEAPVKTLVEAVAGGRVSGETSI